MRRKKPHNPLTLCRISVIIFIVQFAYFTAYFLFRNRLASAKCKAVLFFLFRRPCYVITACWRLFSWHVSICALAPIARARLGGFIKAIPLHNACFKIAAIAAPTRQTRNADFVAILRIKRGAALQRLRTWRIMPAFWRNAHGCHYVKIPARRARRRCDAIGGGEGGAILQVFTRVAPTRRAMLRLRIICGILGWDPVLIETINDALIKGGKGAGDNLLGALCHTSKRRIIFLCLSQLIGNAIHKLLIEHGKGATRRAPRCRENIKIQPLMICHWFCLPCGCA
nr:MAG TPA: hypothetical protein [Caudoviricetes sp.]